MKDNELIAMLNNINISPEDRIYYFDVIKQVWLLFNTAYINTDKGHDSNHIYHVLKRSIDIVVWLRDKENLEDKIVKGYMLRVILASITHDVFSFTKRKFHHEEAFVLLQKLINLKVLEYNPTLNVKEKAIMVVDSKLYILGSIPNQDSKNTIEKFDWLKHYSKLDLFFVSYMVLQHRASYVGEFSSMLCELFSAADRDDLDLNVIVNRVYNSIVGNVENNKNNDIDKYLRTFDNPRSTNDLDVSHRLILFKSKIEFLKLELNWDNNKIKTLFHIYEKFSRSGYMFTNLKEDGIYMSYNKDRLEKYWLEVDYLLDNPEYILTYLKE